LLVFLKFKRTWTTTLVLTRVRFQLNGLSLAHSLIIVNGPKDPLDRASVAGCRASSRCSKMAARLSLCRSAASATGNSFIQIGVTVPGSPLEVQESRTRSRTIFKICRRQSADNENKVPVLIRITGDAGFADNLMAGK